VRPWRPGHGNPRPAPSGVRVVLDARPLQDPARAPVTAAVLDHLLAALDADPRPGESFAFLLASDRDDPTTRFTNLEVVGRRLLPPTRFLGRAASSVDPVLLRGASVGAGWRAERDGAAGAVYYSAAGTLPLGSRIPVVATLLDLAPWEFVRHFRRDPVARFGQRLRGRLLRRAAAVVVAGAAPAGTARRLVRVPAGAIRVVPLAPRPSFRPSAADGPGARTGSGTAGRREREKLGLGARYLVYAGRFDARHDVGTLLAALALLAAEARPAELAEDVSWPPRICLVDASPDDRAAVSLAAARAGVGDLLWYAPHLPDARLAALVAGARALVHPVRADSAGLAALDALAAGVPVVASAVGVLPEIVGGAGLLVEPGDAARLATALRAAWADDVVHAALVAAVAGRTIAARTWADVAADLRAVWASAARTAPLF
jgi:glycosyltransferase involved in cell wall biosynthesis